MGITVKIEEYFFESKNLPTDIDRFSLVKTSGLEPPTPCPGLTAEDMRKMGDFLRDKDAAVTALLAGVNNGKITLQAICGKEAVARGVRAGDIIKAIAPICGGKGGGRPDSAMGGGTDLLKLDDALAALDDFVNEHAK